LSICCLYKINIIRRFSPSPAIRINRKTSFSAFFHHRNAGVRQKWKMSVKKPYSDALSL